VSALENGGGMQMVETGGGMLGGEQGPKIQFFKFNQGACVWAIWCSIFVLLKGNHEIPWGRRADNSPVHALPNLMTMSTLNGIG
jgi:hypothetical protein